MSATLERAAPSRLRSWTRFYLRQLRRETRGSRGRLIFFVVCLAIGVGAVTAVGGLASAVDRTVRGEARQLLAADLAVSSRRPLPPAVAQAIAALPGTRVAEVWETVTVVAAPPAADGAPGPSQLVELKVIAGPYPFYGQIVTRPALPAGGQLDTWLAADGALGGPELLARLGLETGAVLRLGGAEFVLRGVVDQEPDRVGGAFSAGPRVFVSRSGFERTSLAGRGSRIEYRALVRLPDGSGPAEARLAKEGLEGAIARLAPGAPIDVETYAEAQPALRRGLDRAEKFLGLVALLSLLVGGVGVGQTVRSWLAGRLDSIAVLQCLGLRPRQIFALYLGQTAILGAAGSLAGVLLGLAIQWSVPALLAEILPATALRTVEPGAILRGFALGLGVAVLFSVSPLLSVLRVPAVRVLRREAEPLPPHRAARAVLGLVFAAGVWLLAAAQSGSLVQGAFFVLGTAAATLALFLASSALVRGLAKWPPRFTRIWVRHGLAALHRPGAGTRAAIVSFGIGVMVILGMYEVERQLAAQLRRELPRDAPSTFLIDIQPDQWPGVRRLLDAAAAERVDSVPVVMARLAAIDDRPIEELAAATPEDRGRRWALTREQRLTYGPTLPADNRLIAGTLWSDPERAEVSVEEEFARDLGVAVGSRLRFDVQGVPLDLAVTSLRSVRWESFGINFFLVVEPGVLEDAPQLRLAAARIPGLAVGEQAFQDRLAAEFPNVTLIRVREVLERITRILERIGLGVQFLGGFTVLSGIAILGGSVSAGSARRGREAALLKTLGMTRAGVVAVFATEYALIGAVAGVVGVAAGETLAWAVLTRGMEVEWAFDPTTTAIALASAILLAVGAGLLASARSLERRPIEVLRSE